MLPLLALMNLTAPARALEIAHEHYQLDNGLHVILHPDPALPVVVVNLWYGVGSKDEAQGRSGFAHLFEHLMFMGTERAPGGEFDRLMEAHGGWNNAWTSEDATDYFDVGPSNLLETLLWLEADRMDGLARAMTQEKLDLQRDVVRNERRQSYEDEPYGDLWLHLGELMYPAGHPYQQPIIGSHADLEAATVADVTAFFQTWYVPNNASLVVAGDFDPAAIKPTIAAMFGGIPAGKLPARVQPGPVDRPVTAAAEYKDQVQVPMTALVWHSAPAFQPGDAEADLLASVLGGGRSSRLYQRLVHEQGLAVEIDVHQYSQMLGSVFVITAKPAEGHTLKEIEVAVDRELSRLAADGPTPEELERARNQYEMDFLGNLESLQARASALNRYRYMLGDPGGMQRDLDRYRQATAEDVRQAAARLTPDRRAVVHVVPAEAP